MRIPFLISTGLLAIALLLIFIDFPLPPAIEKGEVLLHAEFLACTCADMRVLQGQQALEASNKDPKIRGFGEFYLANPSQILDNIIYTYDNTYWLAGNIVGHRRLLDAYEIHGQQHLSPQDEIYPVFKVRAFTYASFRGKGYLGILLGIVALLGLGILWRQMKFTNRGKIGSRMINK